MPVITVHGPDGTHTIEGRSGETLLSALQRAGLREPEAPCGGNGTCGKCLAAVSGRGDAGRCAGARAAPGRRRAPSGLPYPADRRLFRDPGRAPAGLRRLRGRFPPRLPAALGRRSGVRRAGRGGRYRNHHGGGHALRSDHRCAAGNRGRHEPPAGLRRRRDFPHPVCQYRSRRSGPDDQRHSGAGLPSGVRPVRPRRTQHWGGTGRNGGGQHHHGASVRRALPRLHRRSPLYAAGPVWRSVLPGGWFLPGVSPGTGLSRSRGRGLCGRRHYGRIVRIRGLAGRASGTVSGYRHQRGDGAGHKGRLHDLRHCRGPRL